MGGSTTSISEVAFTFPIGMTMRAHAFERYKAAFQNSLLLHAGEKG